MSGHQLQSEVITAVPKVVAAAGLAAFAAELDPWIKILGFIYIVLQIAFLMYRGWLMRSNKKSEQ